MRYYRNPASNSGEIIQLLKQLLSNTYLLYIQTQGAHWNVVGSDFPQLHTLFETQYQELVLAADLLAEHIRTYGEAAPASAGEFLKLATFEEKEFTNMSDVTRKDSQFLIHMLIEQHQATVEVATQLGNITSNALHTQNLAADRIEAHEKAIWMLGSSLKTAARRRNPYWY